ncbi:MAG: hypothetical protein Q7T11_07980 [Deltaproteobacteria bacterium]|nr:hypothetical protein [Deltaproteobacteria bacterium]
MDPIYIILGPKAAQLFDEKFDREEGGKHSLQTGALTETSFFQQIDGLDNKQKKIFIVDRSHKNFGNFSSTFLASPYADPAQYPELEKASIADLLFMLQNPGHFQATLPCDSRQLTEIQSVFPEGNIRIAEKRDGDFQRVTVTFPRQNLSEPEKKALERWALESGGGYDTERAMIVNEGIPFYSLYRFAVQSLDLGTIEKRYEKETDLNLDLLDDLIKRTPCERFPLLMGMEPSWPAAKQQATRDKQKETASLKGRLPSELDQLSSPVRSARDFAAEKVATLKNLLRLYKRLRYEFAVIAESPGEALGEKDSETNFWTKLDRQIRKLEFRIEDGEAHLFRLNQVIDYIDLFR